MNHGFKTVLALFLGLALSLTWSAATLAQDEAPATGNPQVTLHTSMGDIRMELFPAEAPASVENFLRYANDGFYEGTIFHRVISHFMIQGGGFTPDLTQKDTRDPIPNEAENGLKNERGTVAMARTGDPHSATSQFYINVEHNPSLDHTGSDHTRAWGYAVFGRVVEGMEVVDDIRFVTTQTVREGTPLQMGDVPVEPVIIESVEVH
ncbi:peptidyl-prolyl cis-trans isomerase [Marinihelvus fidelis]|uniref:Peptidyl-prolyl cis-trans isomerase n=1 Tax=Marinihelvus fidelis TaxID=2613842 RepID=A0A5N0TGP7_9GAMM|nr:peptidylprolyl isomerase [Marinihelvus fidelis]KAA9133307.1 peptidyl-prolyl cis-trans isomerase [Marinihelvus fidelis]